ncbi:MAG: hypothetical protein HQM13_13375 [SAR324 cluster bacterium]|nr:hypothetical protein [SAR324 cluster bacterium]
MLVQIEKELDEDEAEEVLEALGEISESENAVVIRLKDPPLSFESRIFIRNNHVLIPKPLKIAPFIHQNSVLILNYTDFDEKARHEYLIAMRVVRPEIRINEKQSALICQIPREFLVSQKRNRLLQRFDVANYHWQLLFPKKRVAFEVLDVTRSGLAFYASARFHPWFAVDRIYHDLTLKWEGQGEIKIIYLRIRQKVDDKISGRIGLNQESLERLNVWLDRLKQ